MSIALSDEQQHALDAARKYKAEANRVWKFVESYGERLWRHDPNFTTSLGIEYRLFDATLLLNNRLKEWELLSVDNDLAQNEAAFLNKAREFFSAARGVYLRLETNLNENPIWYERNLPDATNQLRQIHESLLAIQTQFPLVIEIPLQSPQLPHSARKWPDGATRDDLAAAYGCTPQNVSNAITDLHDRGQLGVVKRGSRRRWSAEHAEKIWAQMERNKRN